MQLNALTLFIESIWCSDS